MSEPGPPSDPSPPAGPISPAQGACELVLAKKGHRFVFRYNPGDEPRLLQTLLEMAHDPRSGLEWFDVALLTHQMGQRLGDELDHLLNQGSGK